MALQDAEIRAEYAEPNKRLSAAREAIRTRQGDEASCEYV
jgi:hypothetical protein